MADPAILLLDEATSNIDTRSEILIQRGLDQLMQGRTSHDHRPPPVYDPQCRYHPGTGARRNHRARQSSGITCIEGKILFAE
ncbi:hypothetical protein NXW60_12505 [Bacteroides fragilis]|nr:hypothetical protein NXW60_12505 [Bacteroides fragilis]